MAEAGREKAQKLPFSKIDPNFFTNPLAKPLPTSLVPEATAAQRLAPSWEKY
ncbi:MAG: hypothetical protein HC767_06330 [Akkermansiaceae bacterium]|nr:hypothetical protein [Akkermansiaceae bacterium]